MKICTFLILPAFVSLILPVSADTFVLKNGSKIEGRLLRDDGANYILEVQVSATIKDELKVAKKDVLRIDEPAKDLVAYKALKALVPSADGMSVDEYEARIQKLSEFLKSYPSSRKVRQVTEMRKELQYELNQIRLGGIKLSGMIYSAEDREKNAYEMDARAEAERIRKMIDEGRSLQALRAYDGFVRDFDATRIHDSLIPRVIQVMRNHVAQVARELRTYDSRVKERQQGLESMKRNDRHASIRAIEEETVALAKRFDAERAAKVTWVTPHPFSRQALEHTLSYAKLMFKKLEDRQEAVHEDAGALYRDLLTLAKEGADEKAFEQKLRDAIKLRIPERYIDNLRAAKAPAKTP